MYYLISCHWSFSIYMKTSENLWFSVFRGYRKKPVAWINEFKTQQNTGGKTIAESRFRYSYFVYFFIKNIFTVDLGYITVT